MDSKVAKTERLLPLPLTSARVAALKPARDVPHFGSGEFGDVGVVRRALLDLEHLGSFYQAAALVDAMGRDARIGGNLETRFGGLLALPFSVNAADKTPKAQEAAAALRAKWDRLFPPEQLQSLLQWGRMVGLGLGQLEWFEEGGLWWPRLTAWRPRHVYWRADTRSFWVSTQDTGAVEIKPGAGQWILFTPGGYSAGWMSALVRGLAVPFLINGWAWRDWARHSETLGIPVKKAVVPMEATEEDKRQFVAEVAALSVESCVKVERSSFDNGPSYDVEVEEWGTSGAGNFDMLLSKCERAIDFRLMGQTQAQDGGDGGSLAKANVHFRVRGDLISSDGKHLQAVLSEQVVELWADLNFGSRALAPSFAWDTRPPEDKGARAATLGQLGAALRAFTDQGVAVDAERLLLDYGVPLKHHEGPAPVKPAAQVYGHHLSVPGGLLSRDELRASLGLPPLGGPAGLALVGPQASAPATSRTDSTSALSAQEGAKREHEEEEREYIAALGAAVAKEASSALTEDLQALRTALLEADTPAAARRALLDAFTQMNPATLAAALEKGLLLANLAGRHTALEGL